MTRQNEPGSTPSRGRTAKREAIVRAVRVVLAREGYSRAGIDAIAAEAGVSTRTIYNHFHDKEQLCSFAVRESSAQVRDVLVAATRHHLENITDLESDLVALARAWVAAMDDFPEHFALIRAISAEADHIPESLLEAWRDSGPRAAQAELTRHMARLSEEGFLATQDSARTARHFHLLAFTEITERSRQGSVPLPGAEVTEIITAGVRAFLHGHMD